MLTPDPNLRRREPDDASRSYGCWLRERCRRGQLDGFNFLRRYRYRGFFLFTRSQRLQLTEDAPLFSLFQLQAQPFNFFLQHQLPEINDVRLRD